MFDISHLHEFVHDAFDYPFTIILVRFFPFNTIKHLENNFWANVLAILFPDQVVFPVLVDLKDPVLHVVIHVVDLVHPLHAVDHHLPQPTRLAWDHTLEVGNHLKLLRTYDSQKINGNHVWMRFDSLTWFWSFVARVLSRSMSVLIWKQTFELTSEH